MRFLVRCMVFQHTSEKRGLVRTFQVVIERLRELVSILQRVNIKFCVCLSKSAMEMIKLLRVAYGTEYMAESTIYKWHSTFLKNQNEAPLYEKKCGQSRPLITEMNINIGSRSN